MPMRDDFLYKGKYKPTEIDVVLTCSNCGDDIFDGDNYYDLGNEDLCEDCVLGCKVTAHKDDGWQ